MIVVAQEDADDPIAGYIHLQIYKSLYFDNVLNIMGLVVDKNGYRETKMQKRLLKLFNK